MKWLRNRRNREAARAVEAAEVRAADPPISPAVIVAARVGAAASNVRTTKTAIAERDKDAIKVVPDLLANISRASQ